MVADRVAGVTRDKPAANVGCLACGRGFAEAVSECAARFANGPQPQSGGWLDFDLSQGKGKAIQNACRTG